ncbi:sigma factor-like helix-turn-helix DNA-binding protein [Sandaracinus amylolyticus]|uniref:Putative DNA-binding regulatory protein n=1 Tax=Sandaracinus amylolyticus TaxID=927083 RepID=A0A0F6SH62_9BACT|nr:sigma factor-like helix-turn-helix DNA-binding protein [Sandaracinus amylolyticus]AKF09889.1 putative DNA-binding regulatory protein [Sandaracinus amylolyticus]
MSDESALESVIARGRARFAGTSVTADALAAFVRPHLADGETVQGALEGAHVLDVYLACACAAGDAAALAAFEKSVLDGVAPAISRIDASPQLAAEIAQELRVKLLVAEPGAPARITRYAGRGPLRSWVQVAAIRAAYDRKRRARDEVEADDEKLLDASLAGSPEHDALGAESRALLKEALAEGMRALSARERTVLRMHLVEDVSTESIARFYRVHRGTVARWISGAHEQVLAHVKRALLRERGLGPEALESMLRLAGSQLDVSLSVLLR